MARFDRENTADNIKYLKSISHHPKLQNAFHGVDMSENSHNIHLAFPEEPLHMHQKGMMMRWVEGLEYLICGHETPVDSYDDVGNNISQSLKKVNTLVLHFGALLSRGSRRDYSQTKLKHSLFSRTKKAAHKQARVLLDLLVALNYDCGRQILVYERTLDAKFIGDQTAMYELYLGQQVWIKKDSFTRAELRNVPDAMAYVTTFQERVTKKGGMGTLLVKDHHFFHLFDYLRTWGPFNQMNSTGLSESHHKTEVKAPSKNTQGRPATFIQQCT